MMSSNKMKPYIFVLLFISAYSSAFSQNIFQREDTIYCGSKPYALFEKSTYEPIIYHIQNLQGKNLIDIHSARIDKDNKKGHVIIFLKDSKEAVVFSNNNIVDVITRLLIKYNVVQKDSINTIGEEQLIKKYPVPKGYMDIEEVNEYGVHFIRKNNSHT